MTVRGTFISITLLPQFQFGNILQFQNFAIVRRTDHNLTKLLRSDPATFVLHRILVGFIRVFSKRAGSGFDVLFCQHRRHIGRNQFVLSHHIRFHPYTHTVIATHYHHIAHTADTKNLRFQVDTDVVCQKRFIVSVMPFGSCYPYLGHFRRKLSGSFGDTILHVYRCHVRIGTLFEIYRNGNRTCIGCR